ncbi:MAG TPA: hypothetical protein VKG25_04120 [Bryobacteraceae bacterium]|nr:hypothetical protein [Bryobacteraceae bacterium]
MRTDAQIEASRVNGAKSQGPVTAEGKQKSSQNAVKHGLSARTIVLCNEDHALFEQLEQDYIGSLTPTTALELHIVQRIAEAHWRMRRAWAVETALTDRSNPRLDDDLRTAKAQEQVEKQIESVRRAVVGFERTQDSDLAEFHRLRKLRPPDAKPIRPIRLGVSGRDSTQPLQGAESCIV